MNNTRRLIADLLASADIQLNGNRPWDMQLHDDYFLTQVLSRGNLALGEAYMAGDWECEALDVFFCRILTHQLHTHVKPTRLLWHVLTSHLLNLQTPRRAWQVGFRHYDLGNQLYQAMLDERMVYTCGYWRHAQSLTDAQRDKLELVCQKLKLQPGMRVLDIGCGWGSFMKYAAEHYGVSCVGITVSQQQVELGQHMCAGLPIEFRLQDYRTLDESFDAVVSLGMFEHVGQRNYRRFMQVVAKCLKPRGLFLLHTIGRNRDSRGTDPWINRYIFPNGELPCLAHIDTASRDLLRAEDIENLSADYDPTLMAWYRNFDQSWPSLSHDYDETFYRMWRYYLLSCAGAFRARDLQVWQWVFSHPTDLGGYRRPLTRLSEVGE